MVALQVQGQKRPNYSSPNEGFYVMDKSTDGKVSIPAYPCSSLSAPRLATFTYRSASRILSSCLPNVKWHEWWSDSNPNSFGYTNSYLRYACTRNGNPTKTSKCNIFVRFVASNCDKNICLVGTVSLFELLGMNSYVGHFLGIYTPRKFKQWERHAS